MKRIIICCSISVSGDVLPIKKDLEKMGFAVEIPFGVQQYIDNGYKHISETERMQNKIDMDLITRYYKRIQDSDYVLIINTEKGGKENYIGGNTFLEMGFAHVLGKPMFVLNPLPEVSYRDELEAMNLKVINGDLGLIK
ncbi:MAG: hypothetical protein H6779_05055 [Candidatus Nomurabacteria bacterium]|nr:hypothetical protein [Candidatus Nomurabacteria bacterium]USN87736.1 MAG: hypothetical protein H6779_05055 [Candidatus Nomurabacteria bacterium]